jgi:hypothetical protein
MRAINLTTIHVDEHQTADSLGVTSTWLEHVRAFDKEVAKY